MITRILASLILIWSFAVSAADAPKAETPKDGAAAILKLLKDRSYSELFQKRYSEFYKAEAQGMKPEQAVEKLTEVFNKNYDRLLKQYEAMAKADFTIEKNPAPQQTETDEIATATVQIGETKTPCRLYKMKTGGWGFHL